LAPINNKPAFSNTIQNSTTIGICVFLVDGMYLLGTPVKHATCLWSVSSSWLYS
jgi:hypothetical protein